MSAADYYRQTGTAMGGAPTPASPFLQVYGKHQPSPIGDQFPSTQIYSGNPPNIQPSISQQPCAKEYSVKDYSIGIICALSKEKAAAECFLDAEHPQPKAQPRGDNSAYTLGSIGQHNVVIASLPEGRYGTTNAAAVARDMIRTFPKIRFGLMVGIGGGAPTAKHDIRLGDIVVAVPDNAGNEVMQYDFGKTVQDKKFQRVESMNNCPPLLKSVVSALKATYKRKGHPLQGYMEAALKSNPRMRHEYQKPDPSTDVLYRSDCVHSVAANVCSRMCAKMPEHVLPRPIPLSLEQDLMKEMRIPTGDRVRKSKKKNDSNDAAKALIPEAEKALEDFLTNTPMHNTTESVGANSAGVNTIKRKPLPNQVTKVVASSPNPSMLPTSSSLPSTNGGGANNMLPTRDDPTIHYGPIASGNQLIRDAKLRDSLAHERNILCFEMEASGLMEHFPSLVIRGICDYADTHKNDQWQGYAAMVAAAYAKDLLLHLPIEKVKDEKPAQKAITDTVANWSSVIPNGLGQNIDRLLSQDHSRTQSPHFNSRSLSTTIKDKRHKDIAKERPRDRARDLSESRKDKVPESTRKDKSQPSSTRNHESNNKQPSNTLQSPCSKPAVEAQSVTREALLSKSGSNVAHALGAQQRSAPSNTVNKAFPYTHAGSHNEGYPPGRSHNMHMVPHHKNQVTPPPHTDHRPQFEHKNKKTHSGHTSNASHPNHPVNKSYPGYTNSSFHPVHTGNNVHPHGDDHSSHPKHTDNIPPPTSLGQPSLQPQTMDLAQFKDAINELNEAYKKRPSKQSVHHSISSPSSGSEEPSGEESAQETSGESMGNVSSEEGENSEEYPSEAEPSDPGLSGDDTSSESSSEAIVSEDSEADDQPADDHGPEDESSNADSNTEDSSDDD